MPKPTNSYIRFEEPDFTLEQKPGMQWEERRLRLRQAVMDKPGQWALVKIESTRKKATIAKNRLTKLNGKIHAAYEGLEWTVAPRKNGTFGIYARFPVAVEETAPAPAESPLADALDEAQTDTTSPWWQDPPAESAAS